VQERWTLPDEIAREKVDEMLPDDYTSDPSPNGKGIPGTSDDVPASYGEDPPAVGGPPQGDLWRRQKTLIDEDEKAGLRLDGFPAEKIPEILEAMGDDAGDPLDDAPNGTSATGLWGTPDHGGFPPRDD
jgi:hypothetical protein